MDNSEPLALPGRPAPGGLPPRICRLTLDDVIRVDEEMHLLREKMAALYDGLPDERGVHSPDGVIVTTYRGDTALPRRPPNAITTRSPSPD